ncbi:MAG: Ku protein [Bradyrhizobiaceae bacterium]|nr:Ku protein [Bradyrhizobiaceae bacterium]
MPQRAYWSGRIRLALVSIPVHLFPATRSSAKISFNQVHKPSGKRIRYEKVVPGIGPVDTEDIVKGYEVEKGKYVLLTDAEIDDVKLEAKKTIDLVQFVDQADIDPIYFERPFFVVPDDQNEDAEEAYVVLREALKKTKKVGLGQLVVRGKGSIVAIKPSGKGLMLETLRYADEIRKADSYFSDLPKGDANKELVGLAEELIDRKAAHFNPRQFKDSYSEAVKELIDAKLEKRPPKEIEEPQQSAQVIDLMQALKRSVRGRDAPNVKSAASEKKERRARPKRASKRAKRGASKRKAA